MSIDSSKMIFDAVIRDTAAKVISDLGADAKKEILTESVARILEDIKFGWEVKSIIVEEAKVFAKEYVKREDVQNEIKSKVIEAAEQVMDGLAKAVARDMEASIKSEYRSWTKERDE